MEVLKWEVAEAVVVAEVQAVADVKVQVVEGSARNLKITTAEDIELFKFYLRKKSR